MTLRRTPSRARGDTDNQMKAEPIGVAGVDPSSPVRTPTRYAPWMLYMIVEEFRDAVVVYRRLRDFGRQEPPGLTYVASWVTPDMARCYQVIETENRALLDVWMSLWDDVSGRKSCPWSLPKKRRRSSPKGSDGAPAFDPWRKPRERSVWFKRSPKVSLQR